MMKKQTQSTTKKTLKGRSQATLLECMGTMSAAINAATPNKVVKLSAAFLSIDPVLMTIHRQLADARAQAAQIIQMFGYGDPMAEALMFQMAALERAYCERLHLLRKKREASKGKTKSKEFSTAEVLPDVRQQQEDRNVQNHGAMWSLAALLLIQRNSKLSRKYNGLVLNAA